MTDFEAYQEYIQRKHNAAVRRSVDGEVEHV